MSEIKATTDVLLQNEEKTVMVLVNMAGNIIVDAQVNTRKPGQAMWSAPITVKEVPRFGT